MITEKLVQEAWEKYQKLNPGATPEQFAKDIAEVVALGFNEEKPEGLHIGSIDGENSEVKA